MDFDLFGGRFFVFPYVYESRFSRDGSGGRRGPDFGMGIIESSKTMSLVV